MTSSPTLQKGMVDQTLEGGLSADMLYSCYHSPGTMYTLPGRLCCNWPPPLALACTLN